MVTLFIWSSIVGKRLSVGTARIKRSSCMDGNPNRSLSFIAPVLPLGPKRKADSSQILIPVMAPCATFHADLTPQQQNTAIIPRRAQLVFPVHGTRTVCPSPYTRPSEEPPDTLRLWSPL